MAFCWGIPQAIKEIESSVMALLEREGLGTFMDKKAIRLVTGWPQNWSTWMMINRKSNGLGCILGNHHANAARGWKEKTFRGWIPLHAFWCSDSLKFWKAQHMSKHQTAPKSPKACNRGGPYGPYGGGPWYDISGCTPQDCIAAAHQPGFDRSNRESPWVGVEYRVSVLADLWYICGERYRRTYRHSVGCSRSSWLGIQISKLVLELFSQKDLILIQIQTLRLTFGFFTKQALSFGIKFRDSKFAATSCELPKGFVDAADKQINSSMEGSTSLFSKLLWDVCPNMSARSHSRRKHLLSQVLLPRIWKFRTFPVLACRPPDRHSR